MKVTVCLLGCSFSPTLFWLEDIQDWAWRREPALQAVQAASQSPAAVARIPHHQLCRDPLTGSPDSSPWSSCGTFNRHLLCLPPSLCPEVATAGDNPNRISVWGEPSVIPQRADDNFFFLPFFFFCGLQTGYMFGKGIYFADMVSKSANYCHTSQADPIGLVLLGEVALGNM